MIAAALIIVIVMPKISSAQEVAAEPKMTATPTPLPTPTATPVSVTLSNTMNAKISAYLTNHNIDFDSVGIYVHDITTGAEYSLNPKEYFLAASTYKLPLAVYYYEQINCGAMSLDSSVSYTTMEEIEVEPTPAPTPEATPVPAAPASSTDAAANPAQTAAPAAVEEPQSQPTTTEIPVEHTDSIRDLLHQMVTYSDNTAAIALYDNIGGWGEYKQLVAKYSTSIVSEDDKANYYGDDNTYSPAYLNDLLQYIYAHRSEFTTMIQDMTDAKPSSYLNGNTGTVMAQKYGSYGGAENSVGFSIEGKPYTIAIYTYQVDDGAQVVADINEIVYNILNA